MQTVPVGLRPATPNDAPTVAEIWHVGWLDGHVGSVPETLTAARSEESFRTRAAARVADTTIATTGGRVAGFVMIAGDEVEQFYVARTDRGTGVADALMAEAEQRIRGAGHTRAWLAVVEGNARARRFYERYGFVDEGPFDYAAAGDDGPISVPCLRYVKDLNVR